MIKNLINARSRLYTTFERLKIVPTRTWKEAACDDIAYSVAWGNKLARQ